MNKILVVVVVSLLLTACATSYHSMGFSGGFDEFKLSHNSYMIRFSGNAFTSRERVYKYALRRAAEITKKNGYKFFKVTKASSITDKSTYVTPMQAYTRAHRNGYGGSSYNSTTTITAPEVITTNKPLTSLAIKMSAKKINGYLNADTILSNFIK